MNHTSRCGLVLLLTFLTTAPALTAREPRRSTHQRVALQPPPWLSGVPTDEQEQRRAVLAHHFAATLPGCSAIRLVSEERAADLFQALTGGGYDLRPADWHPLAASMVPLDVLITFPLRQGQASMRIMLADRVLDLPAPERPGSIGDLVRHAAAFAADALALPEDDRHRLRAIDFPADDAMAAYYTAARLTVSYPRNSGEARLIYLRPVWSKYRGDPRLGEQVLQAAVIQLNSTRRDQAYTGTALEMARVSLPSVLGTAGERAAADLVALQPEAFATMLLELARPLTRREDDLDAALDDLLDAPVAAPPRSDAILPGLPGARDAAQWGGEITDATRAGALRLTGYLRSRAARDLVAAGAVHPRPEVRQAAAVALGRLDDAASAATLLKLTGDPDTVTAFLAAQSMATRNLPAEDLPRLAAALADKAAPDQARLAAETLAREAGAAQRDLLLAWRDAPDPVRESAALEALARIASEPAALLPLLDDPRTPIVAAALASAERLDLDRRVWTEPLVRIANEPHQPLADRARRVVQTLRPEDPVDAETFDLAIDHPYHRLQQVQSLARAATPAAIDRLANAAGNRDAHTRAMVLKHLAAVAPARAREPVLSALSDPHRAVRFSAARLAAGLAAAADRAVLETAHRNERDPALRLYLADALAAIGAGDLPAAAPAAHAIAGDRALAWVTGMGRDAEHSPFDAYYCLSPPSDHDLWRRAHAAGKIVFVRYTPIGHPGLIRTDPQWRDRFRRTLISQVDPVTLPWLDGMVFGEETMTMGPDTLWNSGWRLFCRDTGIDPDTVAGQLDQLDTAQRRQWRQWAMTRSVEGFNELTAYVRDYFGRLRPGIQVATFLPGEANHLGPWALDWDFDLAGIYDYKGDNRLAGYNLVRRIKTLWPDRPILWLSLGIGGYEMNPVKRTQRVPQSPLLTRSIRCYADAMTAWIAGADTGWFSTWIFVEPDFRGGMHDLRGVQILVEDIMPDSPLLNRAIEYGFRGAEEDLLAPPTPETPGTDPDRLIGGDTTAVEDDLMALIDGDDRREEAVLAVAERKAQFNLGFHLYRRYVYDCARLFGALPRRQPRPRALSVRPGVTVWTRPSTPNPLIPAEALLNEYDFLDDINVLAELDLSRYRLIILHDPGFAGERTLQAITAWLQTVPGVLYLHRAPPGAAAGSAAAGAWPWSLGGTLQRLNTDARTQPATVALRDAAGRSHTVSAVTGARIAPGDTAARVLLQPEGSDDRATLALWHDPAIARGAVLADGLESADGAYLALLRQTLNDLQAEQGVGLTIDGPLLQVRAEEPGIVAAAASSYYRGVSETTALTGMDWLTGEPAPEVGGRLSAAIVATDTAPAHPYVATGAGLTALADRPFDRAEVVDGALILKSAGIFRVSAGTADVRVTRLDGGDLPDIDEDPIAWIEWGATEGRVKHDAGARRGPVIYIRAVTPIRVQAVPAERE